MKPATTLVFCLLFFIVAGAYLYLNPEEKPILHETNAAMQLLPQTAGDEITWIQIQKSEKKETFTLAREGGAWKIKFPVNYPADPLVAEGLATALRLSSKAKRLTPAESWEDYGLLTPPIKIGIQTKEMPARRYLSLGHASPVGDFVFARWEKEKDYFLLNADVKKVFDISLYSLRQKKMFRTLVPEISEIRVKAGTEPYEVVKRGGEWFWYRPDPLTNIPIPQPEMDDLLLQFQNLSIKEFLDEEKDLDKTGIAAKFIQFELWNESENPETLVIGKPLDTHDAYYAGLEGESVVFLVSRNHVDALLETFQAMAEAATPKEKPGT